MAPIFIADTLKYAQLQMAAEAFLAFDDATVKEGAVLVKALTDGNLHTSKFPNEQTAKDFLDHWKVVAQQPNTPTGFSGTLFQCIQDDPATGAKAGDIVMSIRSTEFIDDAARDNQSTNVLEIKNQGWALGQLSDLEKWYADIKNLPGVAGKQIDVTGYSLGGHLATEFNLLHQSDPQIGKVVTFNGAGVGRFGDTTLSAAETGSKLAAMLAEFNTLRTAAQAPGGLESLFDTELGKAAYRAVRAAQAAANGVAGFSLWGVLNSVFVPADSESWSTAASADRQRLIDAINNARSIQGYADDLLGLGSGDAAGSRPASYLASDVANESIDYQLAMLRATKDAGAKAIGFLPQAWELVTARTLIPHADGNLANQIDVVSTEMDGTYSTSMVAASQARWADRQAIFIEDQPLSRGSVVIRTAWDSATALDVRLLVNNYASNDFGDTHSLPLLIDSLNVQNLLTRLAPATDAKVLNTILKQASNLEAKGTIFTQGKAEGDVLENVVNALGDLLGVRREEGSGWKEMTASPDGNTWYLTDDFSVGDKTYTGRNTFYKNFSLLTDALTTNPALTALLDKLTLEPSSVGTLKERAQRLEDFGAFAALYLGSPFVLKGQDAASQAQLETALTASLSNAVHDAWVADQALSAADRKAGKGSFSDQWYEDRSRYLADLNTRNVGNVADGSAVSDLKIAKGNKWLFEDAASKLNFEAAGALLNKRVVVKATNNVERLAA